MTYFENLTIRLLVLYVLNIHVKFLINQLINLFFLHILDYKNLKFKYLIDKIVINTWFSGNFVIIDDIKKKCNPIVDLSKFISNKKILSEVVDLAMIKFLLSNFILFLVSDDVVNLTSEMHDPCAQESPTHEKKTRNTLQKASEWSRPNTLRRLSQKYSHNSRVLERD